MNLLKFWTTGCDLREAWFHLAPAERWRRFTYPEVTRRPSNEPLIWRADHWENAGQDERAYLLKAVAEQMEIRSTAASQAAQSDMKTWLLAAVRDGALIAVGRSLDHERNPVFAQVPRFLADPRHVDWEESEIADGERRFRQVRVADAAAITHEMEPTKADVGRPSKLAQVQSAIADLMAAGTDLNAVPRAEAYGLVRNYARDQLGADTRNGFSDPVIQRALVQAVGQRFG